MAAKRKRKRGRSSSRGRGPVSGMPERQQINHAAASGKDLGLASLGGELENRPFEALKELLGSKGLSRQMSRVSGKKVSKMAGEGAQKRPSSGSSATHSIGQGPSPDKIRPCPQEAQGHFERAGALDPDTELFLRAMEGVKPLSRRFDPREAADRCKRAESQRLKDQEEGHEVVRALKDLVSGRKKLAVEKTPEYVQGPGINENPQVVRKLRRGKYAIQAYCDLHGLTAAQAQEVCHEFMSDSIAEGRRCIAYIHGRGLSSRKEPVLKKVVTEFLTRGRFRRWVLAYSSAPSWDGGPGVTYVLLRKRPVRRGR
jgi:DNA-nicking Smr family endonuclease